MATERRRQLLLVAVAATLGVVLYFLWSGTSTAPASSSNQRAARASGGSGTTGSAESQPAAPDVHLQSLDEERPKPAAGERNLFRFKPKAPPPAPPAPIRPPVATAPPVPSGPPPPPPLPPIALKFIGVVEREGQKGKIAVLTDATGHVSSGPEGATIDGRYRIVKIGVESIELSYLDGRGRQTLRLTGS